MWPPGLESSLGHGGGSWEMAIQLVNKQAGPEILACPGQRGGDTSKMGHSSLGTPQTHKTHQGEHPALTGAAEQLAGCRLGPVRLWELSEVLKYVRLVRRLQPTLPAQPRESLRPLPLFLGLAPGGRPTQRPDCPSHPVPSSLSHKHSSSGPSSSSSSLSQGCLSKDRNCRQKDCGMDRGPDCLVH